MGLAGMGVPDHSYIPRAHVLLFHHLIKAHRAKLPLLLKSGMPSSLLSNSHVNLIKIYGVTLCWHLWGWGQWWFSFLPDLKYTDRKGLVSFALLQTNQLFSKKIWVSFGGPSLSFIVQEAWCEAALLNLLWSLALQQLFMHAHRWAGLLGSVHRTNVTSFFKGLLMLQPKVADKIVLSLQV